VFFAPAVNTIFSCLYPFVKVSRTYNIPLFVGVEESVEKAAIDYYILGKVTLQYFKMSNPTASLDPFISRNIIELLK